MVLPRHIYEHIQYASIIHRERGMDAGVSPTQTPYVLLSVDGYPWDRWPAVVVSVLPSANLPNASQVVVLMAVRLVVVVTRTSPAYLPSPSGPVHCRRRVLLRRVVVCCPLLNDVF